MSAPTTEPDARTAAREVECLRCGSLASPQQEYCLECGARLPTPEELAAAAPARLREGARESLLTVLVAFVVAVIAAAAVIAVQVTRDEREQPLLVTPVQTAQPAEEPPVETALPPDEQEPGEPEPGPEPEPEPEPPPPPPTPQLITWPEGTDGWTVILAAIPTANGRAAATARARQALEAGLPDVGVLNSSEFASLHPGYFVVFSGVYATQAEAEDALGAAREAGNPDAYPRQIAR